MKKIYHIKYSGLWMGGVAIVIAESDVEAIAMVKADVITLNFIDVEIINVFGLEDSVIVYNDNGDY